METKHGGSSVEDRLRRLLGAATARFETMREDMRDMERHKEHHDLLLSSLEALLAVCGGDGDVFEREGDRVRQGERGRERRRNIETGRVFVGSNSSPWRSKVDLPKICSP